jgi:hypothetical protein
MLHMRFVSRRLYRCFERSVLQAGGSREEREGG